MNKKEQKVVVKLSEATETLISKDSIFISEEKNSTDIFKDISKQLFEKGLVKEAFFENIVQREKEYPTGMDLSVIDKDLPNIAIPHTESGFVNTRRIVPIKLTNEVEFNNMINPTETIKVKFLFMILNNDPEGQANILSEIMGFISSSDPSKLKEMFASNSIDAIFNSLENKFE